MLRIVLVEPRIPQNTGNIARTCAIIGAGLDLVGDLGFIIDDAKLRRAGMDYWYSVDVRRWENIDEVFKFYSGAVPYFFTTKAKKCFSSISYAADTLLVFGREDRGLPEELLQKNTENCLRIPMLSEFRSLNLASSVAIAAYEVLRQREYNGIL